MFATSQSVHPNKGCLSKNHVQMVLKIMETIKAIFAW